jgi:Ethanolamine utilization protein EutJ (predicted chaperonin)
MEDPEPVMQQLVRVFIEDGTFCPGFQFLPGGQLRPQVIDLFGRALELQIPHNYFTLWMVTPSRDLAGARPVDRLKGGPAPLLRALESYRWG